MAISQDYLTFITDQLSEFGEFETKKMFGGVGFFRNGLMFGMISKSGFRLKVDEVNQPDYESLGMRPLESKDGKRKMPYWEVPESVIEDRHQFATWANKAVDASVRAKQNKS
jgi:DNA transformation protein